MSNEIHKIQKIDNVQEFQALLKAHYLPSVSKKENISEGQNANSNIIQTRNEYYLNDNKHSYLFNIKQLDFSWSDLTQIPIEVCQLKYLTVLNLNNNLLNNLPEDLGNLCNLVTLQLSGNKLNCLPKSLRNMQQLNCLDISHNDFYEVPDVLYYGLRILKVLDLSHNKISTFSDPPVCINDLVILIISHNVMMELPVWIFESTCHLQILDVSKNHMCSKSDIFNLYGTGIFESLKLLNIENCNYSSRNIQVLCHFKNLEVLYLGNKTNSSMNKTGQNYFGNITMNIFKNLICIKYLYLQNVQIATLPSDFDCLKNINTLDLCHNLISWLPECFCNLTSLRILYLTSNQLFFLPNNIDYLVNLEQIHLGNNKLCHIPESFYNLTNLEFVDFYNNKIEKIDKKIFKGKNLKGIDLGLNCINFEYDAGLDNGRNLYECFKNSFRKSFGLLDCRSDMQMSSLHKTADGLNSDSQMLGSRFSNSSYGSEECSDIDEPSAPVTTISWRSEPEDEDWEKSGCEVEEDELFDPNGDSVYWPSQIPWSLEFQKNYCPAKYHVASLKRTFMKNFRLASQKETIEGQFDSD